MCYPYRGRVPKPEATMRDAAHAPNADINVTPFLDILLVLIITFLAAMAARKTMDAQLPVPCAAICERDATPIVLEVLPNGLYRLNSQTVPEAALLPTLRSVYAGRPEKIIQVAGHRGVRYQTVLSAMDVAHSAGVKVIALPPSESYPPR
jgi:biopolymer transport protein ExbD